MDKIGFNRGSKVYLEDLQIISQNSRIEGLFGKSVLVLGATGLLGTLICDTIYYCNSNHSANIELWISGRNEDKLNHMFGEYKNNPRIHFLVHDVSNPLTNDCKFDYIINCAGNSHPALFSSDPVGTLLSNIIGTQHILNYAVENDSTVLYISSGEIYGDNLSDKELIDEEFTGNLNLCTSRSCYPEGKRASEALCQSYISQYGAKVKIARPCRIFGPTMSPSDNKASAQFLRNAKNRQPIELKSTGEQKFSYIYGADAASALLFILLYGEIGVPYNVSNQNCDTKLKDFAKEIADQSGSKLIFNFVGEKGGSLVKNALLDNSRLVSLGWHPEFNLKKSVQRTLTLLY